MSRFATGLLSATASSKSRVKLARFLRSLERSKTRALRKYSQLKTFKIFQITNYRENRTSVIIWKYLVTTYEKKPSNLFEFFQTWSPIFLWFQVDVTKPHLWNKHYFFCIVLATPTQNRNVVVLLFLKTNTRLIKSKIYESKSRHFFVTQICLYRNQQKCASTEFCCRLLD